MLVRTFFMVCLLLLPAHSVNGQDPSTLQQKLTKEPVAELVRATT